MTHTPPVASPAGAVGPSGPTLGWVWAGSERRRTTANPSLAGGGEHDGAGDASAKNYRAGGVTISLISPGKIGSRHVPGFGCKGMNAR